MIIESGTVKAWRRCHRCGEPAPIVDPKRDPVPCQHCGAADRQDTHEHDVDASNPHGIWRTRLGHPVPVWCPSCRGATDEQERCVRECLRKAEAP